MSNFWDRLKPADKPPSATRVELEEGGRYVRIAWDDGKSSRISARGLRQGCPCAECVDEWTHKRTFDPSNIPADTRIEHVEPVGNYAVSFRFSDAHSTGIFNWPFLREAGNKPQP